MIDIAIELSANLFDAFLAMFFIMRMSKAKITPWFFVGVALHFTATTLLSLVNTFSVVTSIVNLAIMLAYAFTLKQTTLFQKILYPILFEAIIIILNTLFIIGISFVMRTEVNVVLSRGAVQRYITIVTSKILLLAIIMLIIRINNKKEKIGLFDLLVYLVLPTISTFIMYVLMNMGMRFDLDKIKLLAVSMIIGVALINIFFYVMFKRLSETLYEAYELRLFNQQVEDQKKLYSEMNDNYLKISRMKHDINGQLDTIEALVRNGDGATADKALAELRKRVDEITGPIRTGNSTVDFIINSKLADHKNLNVFLINNSVNVEMIDPLDLASLIGNIIDNALEALASSDEKRLEIDFSTSNDYQSIVVKNSIGMSVLDNNPELHSTKKGPEIHGLGTKIIRETTEKYGGICRFFEENDMFGVHVLIPI